MAAEIQTEEKKKLTSFFEDGPESVDNGFTPTIPDTSQYYCDAMNDGNINMVLNNVKPELIVLIGFSSYGKSTFVGSLYYYLLTKGDVGGYELYDSDTFSGFERRLYLRNIKNDETAKSKTLRTEEEDEYLLTLTFYNPSLKEKKQLIISDRAGETYKKYVDIKDHIKKDESLPRAQRVLIMMDSTQLQTGWDVQEGRFRQLFAGLKECGKMPKEASFTLLFNKIDLVRGNAELKSAYESEKDTVVNFFRTELELGEEKLDVREIDSKHIHNNTEFETLVSDLIKKDDTSKAEEQRLKKSLDWVGEKLK
jgi:GTPase SAR1 family protein